MDPAFWGNFWPNFWANFASDLIVGIVIVSLVSWIVTKAKKPNAIVFAHFAKIDDNNSRLDVAVRNTGKVSFKDGEIYYHLLVNNSLSPSEPNGVTTSSTVTISGKPYTDFKGRVDGPCFIGRGTSICTINVRTTKIEETDLLFFLSTAHGLIPKNATAENSLVKASQLGRMVLKAGT